jgi:ATP-dependent protease ClpP protease subunit
MKFWNFQQTADNEDVELRIDGDIVDDDDAWIYEWLGMKAASPNSFRNELSQFVGKNLNVWIDSYGGSVFAATGIYNALMQHKETGATVTTIGDGKIMSAAATIFMVGDNRKMSPGCLFMMHNPLTSAAGYASDLRKAADVLDVVKECVINAYQVPTGLDSDAISAMMDDETYMSAKTAIKNGFATEMLYTPQKNPDDKQADVMNFCFSNLSIQNTANDSMRNFFEVAKKLNKVSELSAKPVSNKQNTKGEDEMPINTIEDLKKEKPDLVNQVAQEAIKNERVRITALDALDNLQNKAIHEIVNDAKVAGKTADDIKTVVDIINKNTPETPAVDTNTTSQHPFAQLIADSTASGVNGVGAGNGTIVDQDKKEIDDAANFMAGIINKKNGVVK